MRVSNAEVGAARRMFASLPSAAVATTNADGSPHVVPLWFVWPEEAVFVSTRQDGRTWANALRDPRVAITIDLGRAWVEVAGVEIVGRAEPLSAESAAMRKPISAWHEKYRPLLAGEGSRGSPRRSVGSGSCAWSRTPSARGITPGGGDRRSLAAFGDAGIGFVQSFTCRLASFVKVFTSGGGPRAELEPAA